MNLITNTINQNISQLSNWVNTTPVPDMIDTVTYDLYEQDNPFRREYTNFKFGNPYLNSSVNVAKKTGAELFSIFANPYYMMHKIVNIPVYYKNATELYKTYATKSDNPLNT